MKVFVVGHYKSYANWIDDVELVDKMENADVVMFTGGEDIHPKLYGERKLACTGSNTARDSEEVDAFNKATKLVKKGKKLICFGTCRGAQLLCALNGGKVIQDVSGHAVYGTHPITDGEILLDITSLHHQMMYPFNMKNSEYDIIFWSSKQLSGHYEGSYIDVNKMVNEKGMVVEPEIVLFHSEDKPKCIAVQGHPEMMRKEAPIVRYLNDYLLQVVNSIKK